MTPNEKKPLVVERDNVPDSILEELDRAMGPNDTQKTGFVLDESSLDETALDE